MFEVCVTCLVTRCCFGGWTATHGDGLIFQVRAGGRGGGALRRGLVPLAVTALRRRMLLDDRHVGACVQRAGRYLLAGLCPGALNCSRLHLPLGRFRHGLWLCLCLVVSLADGWMCATLQLPQVGRVDASSRECVVVSASLAGADGSVSVTFSAPRLPPRPPPLPPPQAPPPPPPPPPPPLLFLLLLQLRLLPQQKLQQQQQPQQRQQQQQQQHFCYSYSYS